MHGKYYSTPEWHAVQDVYRWNQARKIQRMTGLLRPFSRDSDLHFKAKFRRKPRLTGGKIKKADPEDLRAGFLKWS
jgi:hypothetical protein